jgi:pheromone shutdown protein TraB
VLLAALARRASGALGVVGGAEFLAARRVAEEVDAQLVLGDRPIEITLQRAWAALGTRQRVRLCWQLLRSAAATSSISLNAELVERLKQDDALTSLMATAAASYPELLDPLIHERDAYLAWSLKVRVHVCVEGGGTQWNRCSSVRMLWLPTMNCTEYNRNGPCKMDKPFRQYTNATM